MSHKPWLISQNLSCRDSYIQLLEQQIISCCLQWGEINEQSMRLDLATELNWWDEQLWYMSINYLGCRNKRLVKSRYLALVWKPVAFKLIVQNSFHRLQSGQRFCSAVGLSLSLAKSGSSYARLGHERYMLKVVIYTRQTLEKINQCLNSKPWVQQNMEADHIMKN